VRVIADHYLIHTLGEWALVAGLAAAGLGYALGQWRRGRTDHAAGVLEIANDELAVLKGARERMAADLADAHARIAKLEAIAEQQQRENRSLRELVMLETIPPALQAALEEGGRGAAEAAERLHEETRARILGELADAERRVSALLRPTSRGGEA
jgi:hypothetical protein